MKGQQPTVEVCEDGEDYDLNTCNSPTHVQEPGEEAYNVQPPDCTQEAPPRASRLRTQHERMFRDLERLSAFGPFGGLGGFGGLDSFRAFDGFGAFDSFGGFDGFGPLGRTFGGLSDIENMMSFEAPFATSSSAYSYRHTMVGFPGGRTTSRSVHQEYTPEGGFKEQIFQDGRPVHAATQHEVPRLLHGNGSRRSLKVPIRKK